jgi:hypothetical protein
MHLLVLISIPGLLFAMKILGRSNYYIERSSLPILPLYVLAAAAGVYLLRATRVRQAIMVTAVLASFAVLSMHNDRRDRWTVYKPNPDWRQIGPPLLAERSGADRPLVLASTTPLTELVYYVDGAAQCAPLASVKSTPPANGSRLRSIMSRLTSVRPSQPCGTSGTAPIRLYVENDSTTTWLDSVAALEPSARRLIVLNSYWQGKTPALLRQLGESGAVLRPVAQASGISVVEVLTPR